MQTSQRLEQSGGLQIFGHHLGAGREAGFDVMRNLQTFFQRLLGHQSSCQHDGGVGGVGAGSDGGNHHRSVSQLGAGAVGLEAAGSRRVFRRKAKAPLFYRSGQCALKCLLHLREQHSVLRTFGSGQAWLHGGEIELQHVGEFGVRCLAGAENSLFLGVALHAVDLLFGAARLAQVAQRFRIDGEEAHGCAVFGSHVGHGGAVGKGHLRQAFAKELHKLVHHAFLAKDLRDHQNQVRGGDAFVQSSAQPEAHHLRREEVVGLAQHGGFRFNAAHPPTQHAQAVDHRGVGVGAHQRIGQQYGFALRLLRKNHFGQEFQIHLVHDARGGRNHAEILKGLLAPAQEFVTLAIALKLNFGVVFKCAGIAEEVHLHGVVDHQVHRNQWIDLGGVAAQPLHRRAHGGQIHHGGNSGEVLEDHARGLERNFAGRGSLGVPLGQRDDVFFRHQRAIAVSQQGFQKDLDGKRQARNAALAGLFQAVEAVDDGVAARSVQCGARAEIVMSLIHDPSVETTFHNNPDWRGPDTLAIAGTRLAAARAICDALALWVFVARLDQTAW